MNRFFRGGADERREPSPDPDQVAVERYRYLLRTAPPEDLERAHEEAFASLTPEQRRMVLDTLRHEVEPAESRGVTDDPRDLARLATRTELRRPGTMERAFGGGGQGGVAFGGFLPTLAGAFMGTAIASMLFGAMGGLGAADAAGFEGGDAGTGEGSEAGADVGDAGGRSFGGEWGSEGAADGGDLGGDAGDLGGFGDFGGGDFGGFDI